ESAGPADGEVSGRQPVGSPDAVELEQLPAGRVAVRLAGGARGRPAQRDVAEVFGEPHRRWAGQAARWRDAERLPVGRLAVRIAHADERGADGPDVGGR